MTPSGDPTTPTADPPEAPIHNPANILTLLRLVLVPVFVVLVWWSGFDESLLQVLACAVFLVASVTDFVDGWVARRFGFVTRLGKVADPIADKALTGAALVLLSLYGLLTWWITVVILVREWGITLLRLWVIRYGVIAASRGGKLKTALQTLAIVLYLSPLPSWLDTIAQWVMWAAVAVTVLTGADYVRQAIRLRLAARAPAGPRGIVREGDLGV
ncbi:CDP-diacylglycerol--glycerol-3-phosphate 3-phosphatidyltransferase [Catenuloplanes atrovinosus]|uniref:CDP-diacylglycerol--glycerol-3-phosphate 3-phosphatidyltransferase n=1 Tax=Catenuloplanes atrovinosus TaxID=137266 RepID=A0AAE3YJ58_9ACTN|nr:CDP-diacylglycerol--glycerol-3-phosphate 3-phosphatidyltransferase [Catenuloplanes atrovinosus]MDR7273422.1 CDP-diacylglycerol--glycerol-3-phosphate 3-phosphatidyltransferase [Catenuloplanes atrovinosus]